MSVTHCRECQRLIPVDSLTCPRCGVIAPVLLDARKIENETPVRYRASRVRPYRGRLGTTLGMTGSLLFQSGETSIAPTAARGDEEWASVGAAGAGARIRSSI